MQANLPQLVRDALNVMGCDPSLIGEMDAHAPIAFEFRDRPQFFLGDLNKGVWLWCPIAEYRPSVIKSAAADLIELMFEPVDFTVNGYLMLVRDEDEQLVVQALLCHEVMESPELMAGALNTFFERVESFSKALIQ
ncbi:hypothetical protein VL15_38245 [Burkholderia cepacia]|uniref:Uncharacterized protein n=1 Tax=Burkholderia cepacia TaxID=292 RepID=A0A0J5VSL7_BURCE|nr:hypothetical protein [Burkholderia cepacia]KML40104.1 hypothetical protein VL15_38245 [Burkholderia cepacia]